MGNLPSSVRQAPIPLKFSRPKPSGSIRAWQDEQAGFLRCSSIWTRRVPFRPTLDSSSGGTVGGGAGGGALRRFSRIHLPRNTGEVRVEYDETVSTLAWASTPPPRRV